MRGIQWSPASFFQGDGCVFAIVDIWLLRDWGATSALQQFRFVANEEPAKGSDREGERRMRVFELRGLAAGASVVASEAFSRSWHFIERDPVLAGHDREALQAELALRIQQIMAADASERDPLRIANRAIGRLRDEAREPQLRFAQVRLAS